MIKIPADLVSSDSRLPGVQMATLWLCPDVIMKGSSGVLLASHKVTNPIPGVPPSLPHLKLITCQSSHLLLPPHWRLGIQHVALGGTHTFSAYFIVNEVCHHCRPSRQLASSRHP